MSLQVQAIFVALLAGAGITLLIGQLLPAQPNLREALDRLAGKSTATATDIDLGDPAETRLQDWTQRAGRLAYPILSRQRWLRIPTEDLAILRRSTARFLGDKILSASVGLITPSILNLTLAATGAPLAWQIPIIVGVIAAIALWFAPDAEVRSRAAAARAQFRRALGAYIELAAYCRNAGIGVTQSLETAARVAPTWVFARLTAALDEAAYAGRTSWSALETVGNELGIDELSDVAHTMELSGAHGTSVYETLRALSASMRNEMLAADQGDARSATQKIAAPLAGLAVIFALILLIPGIASIVNG